MGPVEMIEMMRKGLEAMDDGAIAGALEEAAKSVDQAQGADINALLGSMLWVEAAKRLRAKAAGDSPGVPIVGERRE